MKVLTDINRLKEIVNRFNEVHILVFGDMMLDHFIQGTVSRISPEAPIPIVNITSERFGLGGAANVVSNLKSLGATVTAVGAIGDDLNGKRLGDLLREIDVDIEYLLTIQGRPTTTKTRIMAKQQIVRVDKEETSDIVSEYAKQFLSFIDGRVKDVDAILISSYDKGVITDESVQGIISCAKENNKLVIVDPKSRHFPSYEGATIITPNLKEASYATGINVVNEDSIRNMGYSLLKQIQCDAVLLTRGEEGMSLFEGRNDPIHIQAVTREVYDITGAGDTVVGVIALGLAAGAGMLEAAIIANVAAGIAVGKLGTATTTREELNRYLELL